MIKGKEQTQYIEDVFNQDTIHHVILSGDNRIAQRRKFLSNGGLAYVQRRVVPGAVNIYRFRVTTSLERMNTWIGVEHQNPKFEFWLRLKDGK